jgi:di/tricarboxylate transporter
MTHLVPSDQLFLGFSSDAVISLIAVMIIGAGLERVGLIARVTDYILRYGGHNEGRIRLFLMGLSGICAGILRSVGTVALLLPVTIRIRRSTGIPKARLLMPLSFCAILGSTLTMVGTGPLIMLNSLLSNAMLILNDQAEYPEIGLLAVFPIGLLLLVTGILYFSIFCKMVITRSTKNTLTRFKL